MAQKATFDAGITGPEGHIISRPAYLEVCAVLCCAVLCCAVLSCQPDGVKLIIYICMHHL